MAKKSDDKTARKKYHELRDVPSISITEAEHHIDIALRQRIYRGCIVLVGEAGVGKTQIVKQVARKNGYEVQVINTAQFGLMGTGVPIPIKDQEDFFRIALPRIFPKEGEKKILMFDEINRGLAHAINMFFNMLEDRTAFTYKLPDTCLVCGAMNPDNAEYIVTSIEKDAAFRRRIRFFYVQAGFRVWAKHAATDAFHANSLCPAALNKPCHPAILSYFRAKPKSLYGDEALKQGKQYVCPATVETISEILYAYEDAGEDLASDNLLHELGSSIGVTTAIEVHAHIVDQNVTLSAADALYNLKTIKRKLKKLGDTTTGKPEILADLAHNVVKLLFTDTPDVEEIHQNFVDFCAILPRDVTSGMLQKLNPEAEEAGQKNYLLALMRKLQESESWIQLHEALDDDQTKVQDQVKATG